MPPRDPIGAVSETLYLPLYALALESGRRDPIVADPEVVRLTEQLDVVFSGSDERIYRKLAKGRLPGTLVTTLTLRIRHFDQVARAFLDREPHGIVVSLGSGLSRRGRRVDNGSVRWFDVDLPPVAALRREYFPDTERHRAVGASVLEADWLEALPREPGGRFLFLAEGLFMYLEEDDVRRLVRTLRRRFAGAELVAEVANRKIVRWASGRFGRGKLRRQFGLSEDVWFRSGLAHPREMEGWAEGIRYLDDWTWFDEDEPRLGWMRPFARWELVGRAQYVVRYRLGGG